METTASVQVSPTSAPVIGKTASAVREIPPAPPDLALAHFSSKLAFETDCADVHASSSCGATDFVLIDVRGREAYRKGHLEGAINIPLTTITEERMKSYSIDTFFIVYCAGPHCNGANKAAIRLARMARPVKEMIGGVTGWVEDGFSLVQG